MALSRHSSNTSLTAGESWVLDPLVCGQGFT
jgi:hypothetical protein